MKTIEPSPTNEELIRAIDDLFYAAHQSALYAYWKLVERPIASSLRRSDIPDAQRYFSNGILESSLLLIRRLRSFSNHRATAILPTRCTPIATSTVGVVPGSLARMIFMRSYTSVWVTLRSGRPVTGSRRGRFSSLQCALSISGLPSSAKLRRAEYSTATRRRRSSTSMWSHYGRFLVGVTSCEAMARSNQTLQRNRSTC